MKHAIRRAASLAVILPVLGWAGFLGAQETPSTSPDEIRAFAAASCLPGRIDIIAVPRKFNLILEEEDVAWNGWKSHIPEDGRYELLPHRGTDHYLPWDYDARVPLVFHDPRRVRSGSARSRAGLRDIVPTLCRLLSIAPPPAARGRILTEALSATPAAAPKLVLMLVIDQGGWFYLDCHRGHFPFLEELMARGFTFPEARIDHGPAATAVSHAVLGTGAYPGEHGVNDNKPFFPALNRTMEIYSGLEGLETAQLRQPTLADLWDLGTGNRAEVFVYSSASRAAVGLAGHGADFQGGDRDTVFWFNAAAGAFETSARQFRMPEGLPSLPSGGFRSLNRRDPLWRDPAGAVRGGRPFNKVWLGSPGFARFEGESLASALRADPGLGRDEVTDFVFLSLKATDYSGHYFGAESLESRSTLAEIDRQMRGLFRLLMDRTGGDMVTVVTADHGIAPLVELSGGAALWKDDLARDVEARFGGAGGRSVVRRVMRNGLVLDRQALGASGYSLADVKMLLAEYKVAGKPFFEAVFTCDEAAR